MKQTLSEQEIKDLLEFDEDQLVAQLGMRAAAAAQDFRKSAELAPAIATNEAAAMGDLQALGLRILRRWNRSAFDVVCGDDPDDNPTREKMRNALGLGDAAAIGTLSAALIGMGMMPALGPVLAAIIVKKFFNPA
jgi:hypothetical protein